MANIVFSIKIPIFFMHVRSSSSTPATKTVSCSTRRPFAVDYLVYHCGLTLKAAIETSQKLYTCDDNINIQRLDSVLSVLRAHGFDTTHISKLIQQFPTLLADEKLEPKLEYLVKNGFSGSQLHHLILRYPSILGRSLSELIEPSFLMQKYLSSSSSSKSTSFTVDYLVNSCGLTRQSAIATSKKLRLDDENNIQRLDSILHLFNSYGFENTHIAKMIKKFPSLLADENNIQRLDSILHLFKSYGYENTHIAKMIKKFPSLLADENNIQRLDSILHLFKSYGFENTHIPKMIKKFPSLLADENNIQRLDSILHLFKSYGFENTHIAKMIKKFPSLLADEKLEPKLEYLVKNGFSGSQLHHLILRNPSILGKSLSELIEPSFLMQKHLSSSKSTSFTVDYLVNSCGLTRRSAIPTSKKLRLDENNIQRLDSILHLFKSYGFEKTHIAKMIRKFPTLLADEKLEPKLEYLVKNGFSGSQLHHLILRNPSILGKSLSELTEPSFLMQKHTVDYLVNSCGLTRHSAIATSKKLRLDENNIQRLDSILHLFKSYGFENTHIAKMIRKFPTLLADEKLEPKLEYLVKNGFSGSQLHHLILRNPSILGRSLSELIEPSFLMQKHLSSSSLSKSSPFTVDYLVNSCGLTRQSAITTSQKLRLDENNIQSLDSILHLFKSYGFENTHIAKMIQKFPFLLSRYKVDENLKPKLEYLEENGFVGSHLHELIVSQPSILGSSLRCVIKPSMEFLKSYLETDEELKLAVKRTPWLLAYDLERTLQPNIELFVKEGVPREAIADFFVTDPRKMQASVERMARGIKTMKHEMSIPIDPAAAPSMFLRAVSVMASLDVSVWKERVTLLKSLLGCSQEEVLSIFRSYPTCFSLSEETLRSKVDVYFNTVQLKPQVIINNPHLLAYSLDNRIRPRYNVFKLLSSKKLLTEDLGPQLFSLAEKKFVDRYILQHLEQVPNLLEMYMNDERKKKTDISP